jgi:D-xylono/L-arabinono-1,4-lactonase
MEPRLIADYACTTGENPLWHPLERRLYWTDIPTGRMFRYDPGAGKHEQFYQGDIVAGFTFQADGALLLFMERGAVRLWRDGSITTLIDGIPGEEDGRFNDVIADPEGRVYCGTESPNRPGSLYRLDRDGKIKRMLGGVGISNGIAFSIDRKQMYYTDSLKREIYLFDYDRASGDLSNQRVFLRLPESDGLPDGITVDAEGHLWVALWDGGALLRFGPDAVEELRIPFPVRKVTSLTFCGPDNTDIYVTTAGGNKRPAEGALAGALFHLNLGIKGLPEFVSRIAVPEERGRG